ncbi:MULTISPECIES: hypothetical protein [Micrococcaceae]|uniref:hypothetical protein n=1 Tax=Micrococcaceae TaxID=1268 RepID=UPI001CFFC099|nr:MULTISPECIES: hypothetical protein [Micrococcaceae]MCB5283618.1 hypothetical protein [Arthrobacter sp. ES1]MDJ0351386.1 hypothetical protein [Pseudarthrobacter sp. PH31-O2]WGZ78244.1 hypothetical protein QI450_10020 [Arthrobacter sp. EM1]
MPPQEHSTENAPDDRPEAGAGSKHRKIRPAAVVSVIAVLAVIASLVLFLRPAGDGDAAAAPSPTASSASTPSTSLPPAPAVTYYKQPGPGAGSPLEAVEPLKVTVAKDQVGTSLSKGLVGISLEATDLGDPVLSGSNASIVKLFKEADQPVLRFGGNAVDRRFFWTSSNEPVPASYQGDAAHPVRAVGPADLSRLNTLLVAADATVSLTVDLGHYDPNRAADMAKHAAQIFGPRLLSFTVGNEPNGFGSNGVRPGDYNVQKYVTELKAYANAMNAVAPNVPISGPGAYDQKWWQPFIDADIPQKKILSFHNYPMYSCDGKVDPLASPTMANLMNKLMHDRAADYQQAALKAGRDAGLEVWLPETGIAACPGSNETSRTHGSALWTADYALNAAQLGITRIGFHSSLQTCKGGPPMSVICSGGPYLKPDGVITGRANFFGLSMVAEMEGGKFLKLDSTGGGLMFSYALQNADGSTTVVLVNENNPEKAAQAAVTLTLPGKALTGTMTQLSGPSFGAEDSTVIDGAKSEPVPIAERATVEGFAYGSPTQQFKLTAGTVTVLNFTY